MKFVNFNVKLFDLNMTPQQRKVATYLQEILKWNNQTSLPSNIQISRECKVSVNSISKILKDLKLQILHQDEITGNWYMTMPNKSGVLTPVDDTGFKDGTFQYTKVDIDTFTNLSAELLETYVRMVSLASWMKSNKRFTPSWTTLSKKWNTSKETLRKRAYKLRELNLIDWQLNEDSFISNISVKEQVKKIEEQVDDNTNCSERSVQETIRENTEVVDSVEQFEQNIDEPFERDFELSETPEQKAEIDGLEKTLKSIFKMQYEESVKGQFEPEYVINWLRKRSKIA